MNEAPSTLFFVVLGGLGSVLLSPFAVGGEAVIVFVIPLAVLAGVVRGAEEGLVVGLASAAILGLLTTRVEGWEIVAYAIGAGIGVLIMEPFTKYGKFVSFLIGVGIGTLAFSLILDIFLGESIFFRSEDFGGTVAVTGIQLLSNLIIGGIAFGIWGNDKAGEKKKQ